MKMKWNYLAAENGEERDDLKGEHNGKCTHSTEDVLLG
jgi:hypothetical protein